jgi:hypothetical protein
MNGYNFSNIALKLNYLILKSNTCVLKAGSALSSEVVPA